MKLFRRRRSWKRWLANLMIVGGVLLLAYPLGTWGYTWFVQRELRQELGQVSPQMAATDLLLAAEDFVRVETAGAATPDVSTSSADLLVAEYNARLAAFKAAADAFAASVGGKTGEPIGKIIIPSIGVDVVMLEGTETRDLREGPGHWPETPFPGQAGNFVASGHRTTYGAPFRKFNKVQVGDEIDLVLPYAVARYSVTRVVIVLPTEVEEVAQLAREQVSLVACHPIYSAKQRIVVQGDLIAFKLIEPGS